MSLLLWAVLLLPLPDGFRESVRLTPIASEIAGTPVEVRCARTEAAWEAFLKPWPQFNPRQSGGISFKEERGVYLAPTVCKHLEGWLRGKNVPTLRDMGRSTTVFVHEAVHNRGVSDESETDCTALRELPAVLRTHFRVKRAATLRVLVEHGWILHRASPPEYLTVC